MTVQIEREAFIAREAEAFQAAHPGLNFRRHDLDGEHRYWASGTDSRWLGWLARSSQPSAPALPAEAIISAADRLVGVCNDLEKIKHLDISIPVQIATYQRHIESLRALLPTQGDKA